MSPLPFTPEFAAEVDASFFDGERPSPEKLAAYRALLTQRRDEVHALLAADLRARGRGRGAADRRAARRKLVRIYDMLIGAGAQRGWLDDLLDEPDPVAARVLAGRILEVDYALLVEGDRPGTKRLPEHVSSIGWLEWGVPDATKAQRADREATNLFDPESGLFYEREDLRRLIEAGVDISRLNPPPSSSTWRDRGAIAEIDVVESFYGGGHPNHQGLHYPFPETGGVLDKIRKSQTKPKFEIDVEVDGAVRSYKLKLGGETHSEPVTGALLSVLGFNADVTKHVKNFRVDIGDVSIDELRDDWRSYFEFKRIHLNYSFDDYFDVREDASGTYLVAKDGSLTAKPDEVTRIGPWPWGSNGNEGLREMRGLGILSAWLGNTDMKEAENNKLLLRTDAEGGPQLYHLHHDLGHSFGRVMSEQINALPWNLVRHWGGRIRLAYRSTWNPSLRKNMTFADGRWMVRQIAQLTPPQITAAVGVGQWPDPVARLIVEKLIHRRNQLVTAFELAGEATPSGPIALLAVDRKITTGDGEVVNGKLVDGRFDESTKQFANYWQEFLGPAWLEVKLGFVSLLQKTIGMIPGVIFDSESVGLPKYVVLDLLIELRREVEENPRPRNAGEYYLVSDKLLLGLKVGGGLIGTGTSAFYHSWTLVQPVATKPEAHFVDGTILNVFLPYHVAKERLPEEYVLLRETHVDGRVNVTSETLGGNVPPVGARAGLGRVRVSRSVVERKAGQVRAYRDLSRHNHADLEVFANLVFVRIPFAYTELSKGKLDGRLFTISEDAVAGDPAWDEALSSLVRDGDFSGLEELDAGLSLHSDFRDTHRWFRLPPFYGLSAGSRYDEVRLGDSGGGGGAAEDFVQYRTSEGGYWWFLDWGEDFQHTVRATARRRAKSGKLEHPVMVATWYQRDRDTWDDELGDAYIRFANGIRPRGSQMFNFTPELHSVNDRWGDLEVKVRAGYTAKAIRRLGDLDHETFWRELERVLEIDGTKMKQYRRWLDVRGKRRQFFRLKVPAPLRLPILNGETMMRMHRRSQRAETDGQKLRWLAETVSQASFRRRGWYDPSLMRALHGVLGRKQVSVEAVIRPPPWVENRLVGSVPLVAATMRERERLTHEPIAFDPRCASARWEMLTTFPTVDGDALVWPDAPPVESGLPCDGSRGSFTY